MFKKTKVKWSLQSTFDFIKYNYDCLLPYSIKLTIYKNKYV